MDFDASSELGPVLFHESKDALIVFRGDDLRVAGANPEALRLLGHDPRSVRCLRVSDLFVSGSMDALAMAAAHPPAEDDGARSFDGYQLRAKSGVPLPVRLTIRGLRTSPEPMGLIVAKDQSGRQQAVQMIERFFRVSGDMFCIVDVEGNLLKLNPAWEEVLGYSMDELKGRPFWDLVHPDDRAATTVAFDRCRRSGELRGYENRYRHKDGHYLWLSWGAVREDDLVFGVARDITRTKQRDRELRRAKKAAEVANKAKSQFFASISHEIRTPMTAILALTDVLIADPSIGEAPAHVASNLGVIKSNGGHLLEILNDVLDLTKMEHGKMSVEPSDCVPSLLASEVVSLMRASADRKGLGLAVECVASCPVVIRTDPARLRQVLINLVGNAIKFTERGEVRVRISGGRSAGPEGVGEDLVRFDVIDTGIGLSDEGRAGLFQNFHQVRDPAGTSRGGSGLGLSISRQLVELLGGEIRVESTPGLGSTFSVSVAAGRPEGIIRADPAGVPPPPKLTSNLVSELPTGALKARLLLAEDNAINQKAIALCLELAGAEVDVALNGQEAIHKALAAEAGGRPFDAILMDMQMPVLDGYEATRQLRQEGYTRPIIAVTAFSTSDAGEECLQMGCDAIASKPINWKRLAILIQELRDR